MKKSDFYFRIWKNGLVIMMASSFIIIKHPLLLFITTGMGLVGAEQLITYTKLKVLEDRIEELEATEMIHKQRIKVRLIQFAILITAILVATLTFHKIKF